MKALVGDFNQEKALVGAFSVIVKTGCETDGALHSITTPQPPAAHLLLHGPHPRRPHLPEVGGLHGEGPEVEQRLLGVPLDDGGVGVEVGEGAQHDATVVHVAQRPLASELGREFDESVLDFITFTTVSSLCSDNLPALSSPLQGNR